MVNVKVTAPAVKPVTSPPLVTDATVGSLLLQVPPVVGDNVVVTPTHIVLDPIMVTTGNKLTVTAEVAAETHPVVEFVKVKVAEPAAKPETIPALVTVALAGSLLTHVPPELGEREVVKPTQILLAPVMLTTGVAFTVTGGVAAERQPLPALVKEKVTDPAATPVTKPALVTVALVGSLLSQVPPEVGATPVVSPTQILLVPVSDTVVAVTTATVAVAVAVQPPASVTVTV